MAERTYLNFDLEVGRTDDSYVARVLDSPAGEATADFELPFTDEGLENFVLKVGRTRAGVRRYGSPQAEMARSFGAGLYEAVFAGEVRTTLRRAVDAAEREGKGLRVRLRVTGGGRLMNVPWEYMYSPGLSRFLVLSVETPLVRYIDLPNRPTPLQVAGPLRILMVVSSPVDVERLDTGREVQQLRDATADLVGRGVVDIDVLEVATLQMLQRRLRVGTYHVLHFIGHGGFDERTDDGLLVFEDENERAHPVSGHDLGMLLHDHDTLRLVVLNACEGSRTSPTDPFAGVSQSLVRQGMPAVIGMQFEITDTAAITFSHELYAAIVDGYPIDAATAEARKAIFASGNDVEWGTPVLHMRTTDGVVFDTSALEAAPPPPETAGPDVEPAPVRPVVDVPPEPDSGSLPRVVELPPAPEPVPEPPPRVVELPPRPEPSPGPPTTTPAEPAPVPPATTPSTLVTAPDIPATGLKAGGSRLVAMLGSAAAVILIVVLVLAGGPDDDGGTEVAGTAVTSAEGGVQTTVASGAAVTALQAMHLASRPLIDGFIDGDWPEDAPFAIAGHVVAGQEADGFNVDWQLGWDDRNLYANVFVADPVVEQAHEGSPSQLWRGDSVHFEFGSSNVGLGSEAGLRGTDLHVLLGPIPGEGEDCDVLAAANPVEGGVFRSGGLLTGVEAACAIFDASDGDPGYNLEFAIPWDALGQQPEAGAVFATNLNGSDWDSAASDLRSMVSTNADRSGANQTHPGTWQAVTLLP